MILINGCSFSSLPGQWQDYIVYENKNLAKEGNCNESIFLETVAELSKNKEKYSHVVIFWTFDDRYLISTDDNNEFIIFPSRDISRVLPYPLAKYTHPLKLYKKLLYSYFHSEKLQDKRLTAYKESIRAISPVKVINVDMNQVKKHMLVTTDNTGHFDRQTSVNVAEMIRRLIEDE
jgi:hypothetical protein